MPSPCSEGGTRVAWRLLASLNCAARASEHALLLGVHAAGSDGVSSCVQRQPLLTRNPWARHYLQILCCFICVVVGVTWCSFLCAALEAVPSRALTCLPRHVGNTAAFGIMNPSQIIYCDKVVIARQSEVEPGTS